VGVWYIELVELFQRKFSKDHAQVLCPTELF